MAHTPVGTYALFEPFFCIFVLPYTYKDKILLIDSKKLCFFIIWLYGIRCYKIIDFLVLIIMDWITFISYKELTQY